MHSLYDGMRFMQQWQEQEQEQEQVQEHDQAQAQGHGSFIKWESNPCHRNFNAGIINDQKMFNEGYKGHKEKKKFDLLKNTQLIFTNSSFQKKGSFKIVNIFPFLLKGTIVPLNGQTSSLSIQKLFSSNIFRGMLTSNLPLQLLDLQSCQLLCSLLVISIQHSANNNNNEATFYNWVNASFLAMQPKNLLTPISYQDTSSNSWILLMARLITIVQQWSSCCWSSKIPL